MKRRIENIISMKQIKIVILIVVLGIAISYGIWYHTTFLYRTVIKNRLNWDIFLPQNTIMSGEYMGKIYEQDYEITSLTEDLISTIFVDYYLSHEENFFDEKNRIEENYYQKTIKKSEVEKLLKKIFGPDYSVMLAPIDYGCGKSLQIENDNYRVTSRDPDSCGALSYNSSTYISHIQNYYKEGKDIIIKLKVGYVDVTPVIEEDGESLLYTAYATKSKDTLIENNYNPECVVDGKDSSCYDNFIDYQVILRKQQNGKYYFYKIEKIV